MGRETLQKVLDRSRDPTEGLGQNGKPYPRFGTGSGYLPRGPGWVEV